MGLRIVNNIAAMNTHRQLSVADAGLSKSLERLSSGYRINRAADDAAGLAISQSFRADIASFKVAQRNTSEASSMLQVAEGAMEQIGNMLTRLKELATQAASANVGSSERTKIDSEADKLLDEINRIANGTKYGSDVLINGSFGDRSVGSLGGSDNTVNYGYKGTSYYQFDFSDIDGADMTGSTITDDATLVKAGTWTIARSSATTVTATNGTVVAYGTVGGNSVNFSDLGIKISGGANMTAANLDSDTFTVTDVGLATTGITASSTVTTGTWTLTDSSGTATLTNGSESQTVSLNASQVANFDQ
ncbi:MAG: hypothetical protein JRI81_12665, partial [Deltaproteobacteria bacterium]|nr:hypothetical protein [Deltaproteobacteria bacterium]